MVTSVVVGDRGAERRVSDAGVSAVAIVLSASIPSMDCNTCISQLSRDRIVPNALYIHISTAN